jgi:ketosteroid isomerase-like protein
MRGIMAESHRKFLEDVFSCYSKGETDTFFEYFDPQVKWTIHGEHDLAGDRKSVEEIKNIYKRYTAFLRDKPKHRLRHLVIEGDKAIAILLDEVVGKDGRNYNINYTFYIEISKDGKKIIKIDNFLDTQQLLEVIKASNKKSLAA